MNLSASTPGQPVRQSRIESRRLDIARTLAPVSRAIGLTRLARSALLGFAAGAVVGAGVLAASHVRAFDFALPASLLAAAAGVVAGTAFGILRWPRAPEAARAADLHFSLDDRLTTALELRSSDTPVAALQSQDVAQRIAGLALTQSRGRWLDRREGAVTALAAVAFACALALGPGAHSSSAATHSGTKQHQQAVARRTAAARVQQLTSRLHSGLTPEQRRSQALRQLDRALARLRHQLLRASTQRSALRAISASQQQLRRLALGLHPVNARAVAQLNGSLSRYLNKGRAGNNKGSSSRSAAATAQALSRLAQSLSHLTPAQRAALARALAKAANATSNSALRSSLRQAASSLANGDPQSASRALQLAARSLAQTAQAQAALARLGAAGSQLQTLKSQLSGAAGGALASGLPSGQQSGSNAGPARQGTGQGSSRAQGSGTRAGKGQGTGNSRSLGSGQGRGTGLRRGQRTGRGLGRGRGAQRGTGQASGTARAGNGRGTIAGSRQGASGARGRGGRGRSGLSQRGRNVTVYIPGRQGKGPQTVQTGPNGAPEPGAVVPYQQVVGQYAQSAHQALDRSPVPPSLQGYVRRYFGTISH